MTAPRLLVLADDLIWSTRLEGQGRTLGADVQRFTTTAPLLEALAVHPATPSDLVAIDATARAFISGSMLPRFPLRLAPFALVSLFAATASVAAPRLDREKLLQYRATDGLVQPVRSPAEWALRRAEIRAAGLDPDLLRISVGAEPMEEIWEAFAEALA